MKAQIQEQETPVDEGRCSLEESISKPKEKSDLKVKRKYSGCFYVLFCQEL